jgi:Asp-tRNA(Asn)/Glu-tRNA(Gln) amidotransferase A subunit family amidase
MSLGGRSTLSIERLRLEDRPVVNQPSLLSAGVLWASEPTLLVFNTLPQKKHCGKLTYHKGGSLRIPAACTGIFTLRPSFGRFTTQRCRSGLAGQEAVASVNGPMAKTLEDITMYSKAIVDAQPWLVDPKMLPIPWRQPETKKKLKIAVLWNDGICLPTPPVTRALREASESLKKAGHELVEWDPKLHATALELLGRMFVADGGKSVKALLAPTGEPFRPEMQQYKDAEELGGLDMWKLHLERSELQRQYLEQWMSYGNLDAILGKSSTSSDVVLVLTRSSTYYPLCDRAAWRLQICWIHWRLQRRRLLRRIFPNWGCCG